jgi:hypothetical protein
VNFQPLGTRGAALSDCQRYFITRAWRSERWEVWLQATEGPNELLAKNLPDREAAAAFCERHRQSVMVARETHNLTSQTSKATP